MAKNLQSKLPPSDTLRVYDINPDSVKRFTEEVSLQGTGAAVKSASSAREAAEDSVCAIFFFPLCLTPRYPALFI
jgi:ornithine cyclodeaminase/alanine dehydrogenase-like protein (mu-crystallin family)